MAISGVWVVAILDAFTQGINDGKFFTTALIFTFLIPVVYLIGLYIFQTVHGKRTKEINHSYQEFERRRAVEIKELLRQQPGFNTHCYMCIHFNQDRRFCNRKFSRDASQQRVKDIVINEKKYCLYYHEVASRHHPGFTEQQTRADSSGAQGDKQPDNEPLSAKYKGIR